VLTTNIKLIAPPLTHIGHPTYTHVHLTPTHTMGVTIINPPRDADATNTQLIFHQASMTNTKLYGPGGDATQPLYIVSASKDVKTVTLTRVRDGTETPVATVTYASALARGRGKFGHVHFAGRDAKVPIEEWLSVVKAKNTRNDKTVGLSIGDTTYTWTVGIQSGAHGICTVRRHACCSHPAPCSSSPCHSRSSRAKMKP
jgi:hypothetical protein